MLWMALPALAAPPLAALTAGRSHACAASDDGRVWCWGDNRVGQLGVGDLEPRDGAVEVQGLPAVRDVEAAGDLTCAVDRGYRMWCWGRHGFGPFHPSKPHPPGEHHPVPEPVHGMPPGARLLAQDDVPCLITTDTGSLACPGIGRGLGVREVHLPREEARAHGLACHIEPGGQVSCRRGEGPTLEVPVGAPALEIGVGIDGCARTARSVVCFDRDGRITGTRAGRFDRLAVGTRFVCAAAGAAVTCWGSNQHGQLGLASLPAGALVSEGPVAVRGLGVSP